MINNSRSAELNKLFKSVLEYYGLSEYKVHCDELIDLRRGYRFSVQKGRIIDRDVLLNNYGYSKVVNELKKEFTQGIENSQYIADIQSKHLNTIQTLEEEIKRLNELNMKLTEAFTNGLEYLD